MTSLCYHSMREFLPLVQEHLGCRCIHEIHSHLKATRARKMLLLLHSHCNCNVYSCCMTKTKIKGENSERHMLAFLSHIEKLLLTNLDSAEARWDIMLCYVMQQKYHLEGYSGTDEKGIAYCLVWVLCFLPEFYD